MTTITKRNYGIDLFRIVCIFGVVVLHIMGHGGVLTNADSPLGFAVSWFIELAAFPAVNCFVLISGYVGFRQEKYYPKLRNIISLFFTVFFFSVAICLIVKFVFNQGVTTAALIKSFLPVLSGRYWFFSAYFALFLISPALNLFVHRANKKMLLIFAIAVLFFGAYSTMLDPFLLKGGYSFVWLSFMYVIGAIIKKEDIINKLSCKILFVGFASALLITWLSKVVLHFMGSFFSKIESMLVSYCSPTIVVMSVCLLCLFAKAKITKLQKLISFFASSAFSVYLIHDNFQIRALLISGNFAFLNDYNAFLIPVMVFAFALGIFVICTLIDKIRVLLFKFIKVASLSEKLECLIKSIVRNIYIKICE